MSEHRQALDALVMRGGGVKGLAFAGALLELEKYFTFRCFVGTSAGAIAAALLAAGYRPAELCAVLSRTDFTRFLDGWVLTAPWNILAKGGIHPGRELRNWLRDLLSEKVPRVDRIDLRTVEAYGKRRFIVFAASSHAGRVVFDSSGESGDQDADFAVRCSMSIPFLFFNESHNGHRVLDGGLLANFPVDEFLTICPDASFLALYLGSPKPPRIRGGGQLADILRIWLNQDERQTLGRHHGRTIIIDPTPIRTTDFRLSEDEKRFLVLAGRSAAVRYLREQSIPGGPSDDLADRLKLEAEAARRAAVNARRQRRTKLALRRAVLALVPSLALLYMLLPCSLLQAVDRRLESILVPLRGAVARSPLATCKPSSGRVTLRDGMLGGEAFDASTFEFCTGSVQSWGSSKWDIGFAHLTNGGEIEPAVFLPFDAEPYRDLRCAAAGIAPAAPSETGAIAAPLDGYAHHHVKPTIGAWYAIRMRDGYRYGILRIRTMGVADIVFDYAYDPSGSRSFSPFPPESK